MKKQLKYNFSLLMGFSLIAIFTGFAQDQDQKPKQEVLIEQEEKQLFRKGNEFYKEQNYADAELHYKKALEKNPNYKKAQYNLGNAIYRQNR